MNFYRLLHIYQRIKSQRLRALGLWIFHVSGRRYLTLNVDPILSCNLSCRMCYFSNDNIRRSLRGKFSQQDLEAIGKSLFSRTLKLQIGCGTEPTMFDNLPSLVALGKRYGVPNISITTNGNLLTDEKLTALLDAGLDEIILSAHGLTKQTYERLMPPAKFEKFLSLIQLLRQAKANGRALRVRLNYTVNEENAAELALFPTVFEGLHLDVLQIRPIQKIGDAAYQNYSLAALREQYDTLIAPIAQYCKENGMQCIYPTRENLQQLEEEGQREEPQNSVVNAFPYFYFAPYDNWRDEIDPYNETFADYSNRTHRARVIIKEVFHPHRAASNGSDRTKTMNYKL